VVCLSREGRWGVDLVVCWGFAGSDVMLGMEGVKVMERSVMGEVVLVSFLSFALRFPFLFYLSS
jgi:hypothetical protein